MFKKGESGGLLKVGVILLGAFYNTRRLCKHFVPFEPRNKLYTQNFAKAICKSRKRAFFVIQKHDLKTFSGLLAYFCRRHI